MSGDPRAEGNRLGALANRDKDATDGSPQERGQSARDRQRTYDLKYNESQGANKSRYAQLLSSNQKTLSGRSKRLTPRGGKATSAFMSTPDHNYATQKKQTISPKSNKKSTRDQKNADLVLHGQQYKSNNNLRQNQVAGPKKSQQHNSREVPRRNDAGSQSAMRHQFLEEQIMDLEDKSHSGTVLDHEKSQGKKSRSRNYQLEMRTDPKLEPKSVHIELLNQGQNATAGSQQSFNKAQKHRKTASGKQQQPVPSVKSLNSPGSSRKMPPSTTKHVPSTNIFQLGTNRSKQKFNPKSTICDADLQGHKSQPSNSSMQWQPQSALKVPSQHDGANKRPSSNQAHNNYFVQKKEHEQSKESATKSKKAAKADGNNKGNKAEPNQLSETPQDDNRASSFSGNVFDETRNNGLNRAAIQDSSQHTQYLSTQGNQLHFIQTPASTETPELRGPGKTRDYLSNPYGAQLLDAFPSTIPQSPLNFAGKSSASSPGPASSKMSPAHSSLYNRKLTRGSALNYLVKEIPPETCDLCSLQKGLRELDQALKEREEKITMISPAGSRMAAQNQKQRLDQLKAPGKTSQRTSSSRSNQRHPGVGLRDQRDPAQLHGSIAAEPGRISASQHLLKKSLRSKYLACDDYFNCKLTSDIMYNETRHIVSVFKDYLIYDDFSEYMKRFYRHDEATDRLPRIFSFYAKYSKVYPNYVALPRESRFMFKNIERKQKLIDQRNRRMQEVQEKKAAEADRENKKANREGERFPGDRTGDGSDSRSNAKFNLFNSEFVNNLTDHEFLRQKMAADYNELVNDDKLQETVGFDGRQGSELVTGNKLQVFRASVGPKGQALPRGLGRADHSKRLSLLLNEISMASRSERNSQTAAQRPKDLRQNGKQEKPFPQNQQKKPAYLDQAEQKLGQDGAPFAMVPSISCSFISNQQNDSRIRGARGVLDDPRLRDTIVQGFDLNATGGDSKHLHFMNDENFGDITSILYTDGNEDKKVRGAVEKEDDDAEFAVPSEKGDDKVSAVESDGRKFGRAQQKATGSKGRESEQLYSPKCASVPNSVEQSAKKTGKKQTSTNGDRKSTSSKKRQSSSNTPGTRSGRSQKEKQKVVTRTTQNIVGQAFKNQELLWQAQRASMLKHAILEVEKDAQHKHLLPHIAHMKLPEIDTALAAENGIGDEFERNIGQSEDFQNFLNKYMQQKLMQVEKQVQDNFKKMEKGSYGQNSPSAAQQIGGAKSNQLIGRTGVKSILSSSRQRSRSGERSGSIVKNRSQKKMQLRAPKFTPSGIGAADKVQVQTPQSMRSSSVASLMKDISTGQLLKKLNSNYTPLERIYGMGPQTSKRSTLSTPKRRPSVKKTMARTGSRSQRAEDRLANIFPKYPFTKKLSQKQVKAVDQEGDEDDELPSVDDEYQGLGKNMQERQHQNHQALQRDISQRNVPSGIESPKNRFDRKYQQLLLPTQQQQKIVSANTALPSPKNADYNTKSLQGLEGREQLQPPRLPMKTKKLSELQVLSQKNLKDPQKSIVSKNESSQVPNIASMRLASLTSGSKTSSILQSKPNSSRKTNRMESPGAGQKNPVSSLQSKRDKITVYPTQKAQTMKGASEQFTRKPQGSMYAPNDVQLNTERVQALKQGHEKQGSNQPSKRTQRGVQTIPVSSRQVEKIGSQGAFGPRTDRNYHQPTKSVKTDRSASANFKLPGSTNNIKIEGSVQDEYSTAADGNKTKGDANTQVKDKTSARYLNKVGTGYSPYAASQLQRKRASAGTTLKSYRPNSLSDNSARGSSIGSGPGIYAKMIRAQAQTTTKQRQIGSSTSSARPNYTARLGQLSSQQIRYGSNRPDSVNSQKNTNQLRTKSGSLASASLLTPSQLQGQQQSSMPSQRIVGHRPLDSKHQRPQTRVGGLGGSGIGASIAQATGAKKGSLQTITNSGKGQSAFGLTGKRQSKKPTIFSINTSEQR